MVFSLSEMGVVHPTAGSFGTYAEIYLNPWAGFIVRYAYWMAQVIAIGGGAVAAGGCMTFWFPHTPLGMGAVSFPVLLPFFHSPGGNHFASTAHCVSLDNRVALRA